MDGAQGVKSYHLQMTRQLSGKGNQTISREVWFGDSDQQRTADQVRDSTGALVSTTEVVFNGSETWIATTENGQTRVVHTVDTLWNKLADDPTRENSLADVLAEYGNGKTNMVAQLQGEATVDNRTTYVIVATPKSGSSVPKPDPTAEAKAKQAKASGQTVQAKPLEVGQMTVWVDKQSYLPLRMEVRDQSGAVIDRSEVTSVEYNVTIPDSIFSYAPPAGATVSSFTGGTGADVKQALFGTPTGKPQPAKKP